MSAPTTNVEKQKKRHWPPFYGFAAAAFFVFLLVMGALAIGMSPNTDATDVIAPALDE